ncbi:MAG: PCRF domain-containing protein, partial [Gammaproteobacteria bacterium]|nr:PCRF domain-containing protein [Gammaproteobacteria bacterium]
MKLSGGTFDYADKKERLSEVSRELENPAVWEDQQNAQALGRERAKLDAVVSDLDKLATGISETAGLLEMALAENDTETLVEIDKDLTTLTKSVEGMEFRRMFSGEMDQSNAFISIQAGSGGTEAQDWADM